MRRYISFSPAEEDLIAGLFIEKPLAAGIRDIFSGIVFLYLLAIRARRIVAVLFSFCILIPTVDCITNIIANGTGDWHFWIHGGTALYMAITSVLLFKNSVTSQSDEI